MSAENDKKGRTFHHLKGIVVEEALFNSDGDAIDGTERQLVVLYNESRVSIDEVDDILKKGIYDISSKVISIPYEVAINLSDLKEEDKKDE